MNDGEYEYARMLKEMENEVLALKTIHQRPLGTLNFFHLSETFTLTIGAGEFGVAFTIIVKTAEPVAKPPLAQVGWDIPSGFFDVTIVNMSMNMDYDTWTYELYLSSDGSAQTVTFKVGVISSQPIISITRS